MGFPAVLVVWGARALYTGYRARQAAQAARAAAALARTQAAPAATAATIVGGGAVAVNEMTSGDGAADDADEGSGTTPIAGTCATGNCPPDCVPILHRIEQMATSVDNRYNLMLLDQHGLYANYRGMRNPHPTYGSWAGHVQRYEQERAELRTEIAFARARTPPCPVSARAQTIADRPPPLRPNR